MLDTFIRHATTTLRVLWWMTIVGTATTFGTLYGWQGYGLDGGWFHRWRGLCRPVPRNLS
ncbi:hypothetical protein IB262_01645 [Ensifer sp. ENS02]|uniref:hypothetical protein n=1 Tax=Ensifer sp. ENS02 TaxID=2769290 RepID=UPI00177DD3F6|nr:hypothetical protein [Ensifer sp. ENS02]MBD9518594.1 hypothetical protein [Ensifer sp. ENS02]